MDNIVSGRVRAAAAGRGAGSDTAGMIAVLYSVIGSGQEPGGLRPLRPAGAEGSSYPQKETLNLKAPSLKKPPSPQTSPEMCVRRVAVHSWW